jgi:3-O-methylgallate 3,4-dioxygenase
LLKSAKPGLENEITIDVQRRRHAGARRALTGLTQRLSDAKPDVIVVISNAHRIRPAEPHPVFGILRASSFPVMQRSGQVFDPDARFVAEDKRKPDVTADMPGCAELGTHLIDGLISDGFDIACIDQLPKGAALDDAFGFTYEWLLGGQAIPLLPVLISRDLPNQATVRRCYDLGLALRKHIESWPKDLRVAVVASGGLSHQIIDEELDRKVIDALIAGELETLQTVPRARLNGAPGTPEILNWVIVAGTMAPERMTLVDYLPCYRSMAGTGHGLTFGYW